MHYIQKWLFKHQYRQEKFVSLYDMMFDAKDFPYLAFRLSLFNLQLIFHFFTHAVLFYFMAHKLASRTFTTLIFVNGIKMLIDSGWWGGLEVLRSQVRTAYETGNKEEMNKVISFWITLSLFLAIPFVGISFYFAIDAYWKFVYHDPMFRSLFISLISLSVAFHIPIGAFHSGIYGISRVMRPRFSMILSYLVGLCVLFATYSELGIYAILVSLLAEFATSSALTWYYTLNMYELYNITLAKLDHHDFRRRLSELPIYQFVLGFLANIFIMVDSVLIIVFYFLAFAQTHLLLLLKIIYLISPLICASSDWARLFYFDRKQLENDQLSVFIDQYDKSISRTASFLGFCFGVTSIVACYLLISPQAAGYTFVMLPFFLMRSIIADRQVKAFTDNQYYDVIFSGLMMISCWIGIYMITAPLLMKGFMVAVAMLIIHGIIRKYRFPPYMQSKYQNLYTNLYYWLSTLNQKEKPVEIFKLHLDQYVQTHDRINLIRRLMQRFNLTGDHICLNGDHPLFFYLELDPEASHPHDIDFSEIGFGIIRKVEREYVGHLSTYTLFDRPIYTLADCPLLQDVIEKPLKHAQEAHDFPQTVEELTAIFTEQFPTGTYYDPKRHLGTRAVPLPLNVVRKFTMLIWQYLFKQRGNARTDTDLTLLFDNGLIRVIYVIPREEGVEEMSKKVRNWHLLLNAFNVREALKTPEFVLEKLPHEWYSQHEKGFDFA